MEWVALRSAFSYAVFPPARVSFFPRARIKKLYTAENKKKGKGKQKKKKATQEDGMKTEKWVKNERSTEARGARWEKKGNNGGCEYTKNLAPRSYTIRIFLCC